MKSITKNIIIAFVVFLAVAGIFSVLNSPESKKEISLSQLAREISQDNVTKISISRDTILVTMKDKTEAQTFKEEGVSLTEAMKNLGVEPSKLQQIEVEVADLALIDLLTRTILPILLPFLLIGGFLFFMLRGAQNVNRRAISFGNVKSQDHSQDKNKSKVKKTTFKDVAGNRNAKEELTEIVDFLRNPQKFTRLGARIPHGVLLLGPPGVGKTLLAKAVAGEAKAPFFHISASEFVELFVGVGASVTGDTPVLIKKDGKVKLLPIKKVVDPYYKDKDLDIVKKVSGIEALGFKPLKTKFPGARSKKNSFFGGSQWSSVQGVYRHKVKSVYEIKYLGGTLRTTGDHSVFVRSRNMIKTKKASQLRPGDILVNLPFKVRGRFMPGIGTIHKVRSHSFAKNVSGPQKYLNLYKDRYRENVNKYEFAVSQSAQMSQRDIGAKIGVSQATIGNWLRGKHQPQFLNSNLVKAGSPQKVETTESLMRLLGYYTAEGRTTKYYTQFVFGLKEKKLHKDCIDLIQEVFSLTPSLVKVPETNSYRINISSPVVAEFFAKHCGNGSHHKHIPEILWHLPKKHFLAYLKGYSDGDGYTTANGKLSVSSVSRQLITELAWLCAMHGIQVGVRKCVIPPRVIRSGGQLVGKSISWNLIIGKTSHPFTPASKSPNQFKKPRVISVTKKSYNDYVYDLCGCNNEAFFGGYKPTLLHNSRVRDLFSKAKRVAPAIVFIDEIDAVGRQRGAGLGGSHDEREQTLNQILVELDGFDSDESVIVMAATNRPDVLDPALLRPGRFDRRVILDLPDIGERLEILKVHAKNKPIAPDVRLRSIAERTPGFSGADLANIINEAALLSARVNKRAISQKYFLDAIEKVMLGPERKSHLLSEQEKKITAYHEAGHAVMAHILPMADPVHKVSVISRGQAAGYTLKLPIEDKRMHSKKEFLDDLSVLLAGFLTEKKVFGDITTGASNDLRQATKLVRSLVTQYGMSSKLGPMTFGEKEELVFLGRDFREHRNYSEKVASLIDAEIRGFIKRAKKRTQRLLDEHRDKLELVAKTLIERETLEKEEFEKLMADKPAKNKKATK